MASTDLHLSQPLTLPSGLTLPNRLVKAAMAEAMAQNGQPSPKMHAAYTQWARGNWGLILTGNVQVDSRHLGQPNDVTVTPDSASTWRAYADAAKENDTKVVMQLCHPGRQSPLGAGTRGFWGKTLAPSAVPLQLGPGLVARAISALVFGTPKAMSEDEIREVVDKFAAAARLAAESGFDGVELHAAHGYLLAQFLSAQSNVRTDGYGGDAVSRARIVVEVVKAVRKVTPKGFTVGIKLNSVDHQSEKALAEVVAQLKAIVEAGVDFVEVSGGSYEDPAVRTSTPFFLLVAGFQHLEVTDEPTTRCSAIPKKQRSNPAARKPARPSSSSSHKPSAPTSPTSPSW